MSYVQIVLGCLVFAALLIPIVQLAFGFHYVGSPTLCPLQPDIMLLMAIGGVFEAIFFAATIGLICTVIPRPPKKAKKNEKSVAQASAEGSNRASKILFACVTSIFGICAIIFFVLIHMRVLGNLGTVQSKDSSASTYCLSTIFSSAFALMIATYVAFLLIIVVLIIMLCTKPKKEKPLPGFDSA